MLLENSNRLPALTTARTAYAEEVDKQRSIEAVFQKHIAKPIDILELITTIGELIDSAI